MSSVPIDYLQKAKLKDFAEIDMVVSGIFEEYKIGMYFEEFCSFTQEVCSDLYLAVFDSLFQYVPCVKNFMILRANYLNILNEDFSNVLPQKPSTFTQLPRPLCSKFIEKIINLDDDENEDNMLIQDKIKLAMKGFLGSKLKATSHEC